MVNRKKRLERGIVSIDKQIKIHLEKQARAKEKGNLELEGYYGKEISGLENTKKKKEEMLKKEDWERIF